MPAASSLFPWPSPSLLLPPRLPGIVCKTLYTLLLNLQVQLSKASGGETTVHSFFAAPNGQRYETSSSISFTYLDTP